MIRRRWYLTALLVMALGATVVFAMYRSDMARVEARLAEWETLTLHTRYGPVETVVQGEGPALLMIHGTGGGFDQGAVLAQPFAEAGFRTVAPSRFGYLGTAIPEGADAVMQAEAFADLLDELGIEQAVISGASAGAITALHFAARYPERTLALLPLVPAYYPETPAEPWSPFLTRIVTAALQSDFLFWAGMKLAPGAMQSTILATDADLIEASEPEEQARLWEFFELILPISARADGLLLDTKLTANPVPVDLKQITSPTFVASAEDDHYRTADSARLIAAGIEGARLFITPDGGHVWAGRLDEVTAEISLFLASIPDT